FFFFFQAEDGIRDRTVTGVQTCALPISNSGVKLVASWDGEQISVEVVDDGPGFAAEILEQLGEPYVTSRMAGQENAARGVDPARSEERRVGKECRWGG